MLLSYVVILGLALEIRSDVIEAVDSDYLSLYVDRSSIPDISGSGVFARNNIEPDVIVCEYRGAVVPRGTMVRSDKLMDVIGPDGQEMSIVGGETPSICPLINDCAKIYNTSYSQLDLENFHNSTHGIPTYSGVTYSVKAIHMNSKVFYMSTRKIIAGEEIFVSYGRYACHILCFCICIIRVLS